MSNIQDENNDEKAARQDIGNVAQECIVSQISEDGEQATIPVHQIEPDEEIAEESEHSEDVVSPTILPPPDSEGTQSKNPYEVSLPVMSGNWTECKTLLVELGEKLDSLTRNVDFGTKFAEKKQEQIDKLYEENRHYKDDIIEKFKEKLVMGIIEQLAQADRQIQSFKAKEESEKTYNYLLESFQELADDFREMLSNRFSVEAYDSQPGEPYNTTKHQVLKDGFLFTDDESKNNAIASSVRYGYTYNGKILRQEIVKVYRYQAPSDSLSENDKPSEEPPQTTPVPDTQETLET